MVYFSSPFWLLGSSFGGAQCQPCWGKVHWVLIQKLRHRILTLMPRTRSNSNCHRGMMVLGVFSISQGCGNNFSVLQLVCSSEIRPQTWSWEHVKYRVHTQSHLSKLSFSDLLVITELIWVPSAVSLTEATFLLQKSPAFGMFLRLHGQARAFLLLGLVKHNSLVLMLI